LGVPPTPRDFGWSRSQPLRRTGQPAQNRDRRPRADFLDNPAKLEALQHSIEGVGLWEGIIGRRVGNRVQLDFGHHRIEAARRAGLTAIPIIIRDLNDEDMLRFLGRENLEDYNADFLVMLETWEAASEYCGARAPLRTAPISLISLRF
jgi:ParB-like chromosome segregation protein Spo0J